MTRAPSTMVDMNHFAELAQRTREVIEQVLIGQHSPTRAQFLLLIAALQDTGGASHDWCKVMRERIES